MLILDDLTVRIAGRTLIENASVRVPVGARVGLVGRNGTGKSTLFNVITSEHHAEQGHVVIPSRWRVGRLAQEAPSGDESLIEIVLRADSERTCLLAAAETAHDPHEIAEIQTRLSDIGAHAAPARAAAILAGLGFNEAHQQRAVSEFSGGWRMRVALAATLFAQPDLLLLDEPTNHLDMRAKDVLLESLEKYNGTVVFVSHDRYFIDKLANRIFEIGDGRVEVFPGNYEDYMWRKQRAAEGEDGQAAQVASAPTLSDVPGYESPKAESRKRMNPIKLKQLQDRCQQLEEEIAELEGGIADCELKLQSFVSAEETQRQVDLLARHREDLAARMAEWEELSQALETSG